MKAMLMKFGVILLGSSLLPASCRGGSGKTAGKQDMSSGGAPETSAAVDAEVDPKDVDKQTTQPLPDTTHLKSMTVKKLKEFPEKTSGSVAFHPDGKRWYSASTSQLFLWENDSLVKEADALLTTRGHLAVSMDGKFLLGDRSALDLASKKPDEVLAAAVLKTLPSPSTGYEVTDSALSRDMKVIVASIQFRPPRLIVKMDDEGKTTYTPAGPSEPQGPDSFVALYHLGTGKETVLTDHHTLGVPRIYMQGDLAAYCDYTKDRIYVWNLKAPAKPAAELTSKYEPIGCVLAFSPDGSLLASAKIDTGDLSLWETGSGKLLREWSSGRERIESIAFHPKTFWLAAGDTKGHVDIWRFDKAGKPKTVLKLPVKAEVPSPYGSTSPFITEVRALHFSPGGDRMIVGLDLDGSHVMIYSVQLVE